MPRKKINPADHVGLVYAIAKSYKRTSLPAEDIAQEGMIGLMRAAELFNPKLGFAFSTYAQWWIRSAIGRFIQENETVVRLPAKRLREARRDGTTPVRVSMDVPFASQYGTDAQNWHEIIADDRPSPEDVLIEKSVRAFTKAEVARLPARTRHMIRLRFGEDMTLAEIGQVYDLSRERIRQILVEAFRELRPRLESET